MPAVSRDILTLKNTRRKLNMNTSKKVRFLALGAVIAALYAVLTYVAAAVNLAYGPVQFRFSEALTVLPVFTPAAIPGLTLGCVIANLCPICGHWGAGGVLRAGSALDFGPGAHQGGKPAGRVSDGKMGVEKEKLSLLCLV